jgi:hypothetical protein
MSRPPLLATLAAGIVVVVAVLLASPDIRGNSFSGHVVSPPSVNRSRCVTVDFEANKDSFEAVNRAIDHAQHFQICERVLAGVDPLALSRQALKTLAVTLIGVRIDVSPYICSLRIDGLRTLIPLHVNVTSPSSLQVGWRSTGILAIEATVEVEVEQRDKRWWQPCWVSPWHPSSCPSRSATVEMVMAVSNASGVAEIQVEMFRCPSDSDASCQDLSAMDLVAAVIHGRPEQFMLRLFNRIERLALKSFTLELERIEHLHVHIANGSDLTNALIEGAAELLERRMNRKGTTYRTVLDGIRDSLVAAANHAIGRWVSPLFLGSCLDESADAPGFDEI